ncbi:hypothetical protein MSAN_01476800 [Mycena sanguinolenta]|uniref:Uncharacterized protein n=1 Tax=Mycena sanguinolenta TaxID=230812 RepID=A0A8H6YBZ9_9AGAR|nr:hypothetical protein MSAN_01476800 [Mycena sanguinolenta]
MEQGEKEKEGTCTLWTHRGSISNCISTRTSAFTLAVAVRLQAAPLSVRPPNRSSSPHLSLRGCSEGGNDHRPTTFGNVATHVCLRTTSSAGAVLARLCVGQSGDVDQGFYTGKPVF